MIFLTLIFFVGCERSVSLEDNLSQAVVNNDIKSVQKFIKKGADVNISLQEGATLLMLASSEGQLEVVKILLSNGANVNAKDKTGKTALWLAKLNGRKEIVKLLLAAGAR